MNILFISATHNPFDKKKTGSIQRTHLLLEACARCGNVDVVVLHEGAISDIPNCEVIVSENIPFTYKTERLSKLKRLLTSTDIQMCYPVVEKAERIIDKVVSEKHYDFIVTRYLPSALHSGLIKYSDRLIVDVDDSPVDVERWLAQNATTWKARIYHVMMANALKGSASRFVHQIRCSFFSNPTQVKDPNAVFLPNVSYYEPMISNNNNAIKNQLLFVGDLRYEPNYKGIEHFVDKIFPIIKSSISDVQMVLVGKTLNRDWEESMQKHEGVVVKGFVEDLEKEYAKSKVVVVPVYMGAGTNIKVLEALQMKRACVVTECAMRGFSDTLVNNRDLQIAKSDTEFADEVIFLLQNNEQRRKIAANGYMTVRDHYSKSAFAGIVKETLTNLEKYGK